MEVQVRAEEAARPKPGTKAARPRPEPKAARKKRCARGQGRGSAPEAACPRRCTLARTSAGSARRLDAHQQLAPFALPVPSLQYANATMITGPLRIRMAQIGSRCVVRDGARTMHIVPSSCGGRYSWESCVGVSAHRWTHAGGMSCRVVLCWVSWRAARRARRSVIYSSLCTVQYCMTIEGSGAGGE